MKTCDYNIKNNQELDLELLENIMHGIDDINAGRIRRVR